jgi:signal transduction histidine kinase
LTSWVPSKDASGKLEFVTCVAQDITSRKKAEETLARQQMNLERLVKLRTKELLDSNEALKASRQELRDFAARLTDVQEQGYRTLARELHDVFGQHLALLAMQVGALSNLASHPSEEFLQRAKDARQEIERLSSEIHALSRQLHPSILDDLGLAAAVAELCQSCSDSLNLETTFTDVGCEDLAIPQDIELSLYRVAQECLTNVAKHAGDPRVDVSLVCERGKITLTIRDYGRGFAETGERREPSRLGLAGMKERIAQIGGMLRLDSQIGQGATITAEVSLDGHE